VGHTHHWRYQPNDPAWAAVWPSLIHDTTLIVQEVSRTVALAGPGRNGPPVIDAMSGIAFNGADDAGCDSFLLPAPGPQRRHWFYCNTHRLPYDLAVTATLLRCHFLAPDTFVIGGDGSWHRDWRPARDLIQHLFGHDTDRVPLTDTTAGLTVEQLLGL
jgi:hypothetical protein